VPVQVHPSRRETRWSTQPPRPSAATHAQPYRRRPAQTATLHRIVREHLETYVALANESDPMGDGVPDHVEKEFRDPASRGARLKCGILAHGFARARCAACGYDLLVAFSCKARGGLPVRQRQAYGRDGGSPGGQCPRHSAPGPRSPTSTEVAGSASRTRLPTTPTIGDRPPSFLPMGSPPVGNQERSPRTPPPTTSFRAPSSIPLSPSPFLKTISMKAGASDLAGRPAPPRVAWNFQPASPQTQQPPHLPFSDPS
jgi:hypothetical protein